MEQCDLKVWWIPQVPMKAFEVPVTSVEQGRWLCDVLADYDEFQYENRVKPDYANAGGVVRLVDGKWEDVEEEDDDGDCLFELNQRLLISEWEDMP